MKKLFSVILAILMLTLTFTACSEEQTNAPSTEISATVENGTFTPGVYCVVTDEAIPDQLQIRDNNKIAIQYESKTITEAGKYTIEGDVLRVTIEKNGCEYVFNIKDGSLFYDAEASKPSEKFVAKSMIADGTELRLDHVFEAR